MSLKIFAWLCVGLSLFVSGTSAQTVPQHVSPPVIDLTFSEWTAPVEFTQILSIRELEDGVLVSDRIEGVSFLPWSGAGAIPVGRSGSGPEEYQDPSHFFPLGGDSTLLVDAMDGRWLLLAGPKIIGTVGSQRPLNRLFRTRIAGTDDSGHVLGERPVNGQDESRDWLFPDSVFLILADRKDEKPIDTIARLRGEGDRMGKPIIYRRRATQLPYVFAHSPLTTHDRGLLFSDGWIAVLHLDPYRVDWRRPDGTWVMGTPLPFTEVPLGRREQCAAMERVMGPLDRCAPEELDPWPSVLPPFVNDRRGVAYAAPDGSVLIKRTPTAREGGNRYDLVDRSGSLIAMLSLPENQRVVGFGKDAVYTVLVDSLDLQSLRRHPWPSRR